MKLRWDKWLYGLGGATIGGGAGAVVSGMTSIMIAPGVFNLNTLDGAIKVLTLMAANFFVSGFFSMFFYLKQAPLPDIEESDTKLFRKTVEKAVEVEKVHEKERDKAAPPVPPGAG